MHGGELQCQKKPRPTLRGSPTRSVFGDRSLLGVLMFYVYASFRIQQVYPDYCIDIGLSDIISESGEELGPLTPPHISFEVCTSAYGFPGGSFVLV